jgi:hypothetical protein
MSASNIWREEGTTGKILRIELQSQGRNPGLTGLYVPYSLDSGFI